MILKAVVAWQGDSSDLTSGAGHRFGELTVLLAFRLRCANHQPRCHFEPVDVGKYVQYFLRDPVREVALVALRRKIRKGEYRNGCDGWRRRPRSQCLRAALRAMLAGNAGCA